MTSSFSWLDPVARGDFVQLIAAGYNLLLTVLWPVLALGYTLRSHRSGRQLDHFRNRLGISLPIRAGKNRCVWIHALSVGETVSAASLVRTIKAKYPDLDMVFSTATESGQEIARGMLNRSVDLFFTLPHDFGWAMRTLIRRLRPALFIQVETDIWPNLLWNLARRQIPAVLVNGRISPASLRRLMPLRRLYGPVLRCFDRIFVQSTRDRSVYEALGFPAERIYDAGNLKFDQAAAPIGADQILRLREETGIASHRPAWIAGSTHEGEEKLLLEVHRRLLQSYPDLLLILAPRHPERAASIRALCRTARLPVASRSAPGSATQAAVFVLDSLGELAQFYALADCAFIGGSLIRVGGHNPLEPLSQGKPVLWGPYFFNFQHLEELLIASGCGRRVSGTEQLFAVLHDRFAAPAGTQTIETRAALLFRENQGCSQRIMEQLADLIIRA
jgi:3-deoxy-D-manno-octulosonic-acid transferase